MATRSLTLDEVPLVERRPAVGSWGTWAVALDVVLLAAASVAAELGARGAGVAHVATLWLVGYSALVLLLLRRWGLYDWHLRVSALDDIRAVLASTVTASALLLTARALAGNTDDELAAQALRLFAFSAVYLAAGRVVLDWALRAARQHGEGLEPTLVVGRGRVGSLIASRLRDHPELGLAPVGLVDDESPPDEPLPVPVLGASRDLEQVVERHRIEHLVLASTAAPSQVLLDAVRRCEEGGVHVSVVPPVLEQVGGRLSAEHIGGLPLLSAHRTDPQGWQFALKYTVDRIVAAALLLLVLPVFAALTLGTLVSVGRPIFFRQRRFGLDGREFEMLKFRSMRAPLEPLVLPDLPADTAPGGVEGDDRRTRFGSFLRRTSLDELPQLLNVLRGEMSLVGPRPERPDFARHFERNVYRYGDRHRVKSGITGWAQVHGLRGKTSLSDRVEWDNFYIENWSLWLDVKILLMTVAAVGRYFAAPDA